MTIKTGWIDLLTLQDVAKAQADGWEIEYRGGEYWAIWGGLSWQKGFMFRGRPRQPEMKEVKMFCWINGKAELVWIEASFPLDHAIRQPHLDMIAKVPV